MLDEYELNGCICGSRDHGINYKSYKNREYLATFDKGVQEFSGIYHKVGYLHYNHEKRYALITNITCGTPESFMNHTYVQNVTPKSMELLKSITPGTHIQFKANICQYNSHPARYGLINMHHITVIE